MSLSGALPCQLPLPCRCGKARPVDAAGGVQQAAQAPRPAASPCKLIPAICTRLAAALSGPADDMTILRCAFPSLQHLEIRVNIRDRLSILRRFLIHQQVGAHDSNPVSPNPSDLSHAPGNPHQAAMATIHDVPDEIIRQIIQHVPPEEAFDTCPLVSKTFKRVAFDSLLWKCFCQSSFRFWHPEHRIKERLRSRASQTPWRDLWRRRKFRNDLFAQLLNEIIATKIDRFTRMGHICQYGYDAKDFLLAQVDTPDSVEDYLARR